jgi:uncharacterized delta-60 repeat protein
MTMIAKFTLIIFLFLESAFCFAQQWSSTYSSNTQNDLLSDDKAFSIAVSKSENVYVTGFSLGDTTGYDICTIKYNSLGDTQWVRIFNGSGNQEDKAYAIVVDDLDNVYVTGYITNTSSYKDIITIKYSADGNLVWYKTYHGSGYGENSGLSICLDAFGNVYVAGYTTGASSSKDIAVIKYSWYGYRCWTYIYNGTGNSDDIAFAIARVSTFHLVLTGFTRNGTTEGTEDIITTDIVTYSGNAAWTKIFNGSGSGEDKAYAITVDDLDNIFVTGYSTSVTGGKNITTIKYSSGGAEIWYNDEYDRGFDDIAKSIDYTPDGGAVVTGLSKTGTAEGTEDYVTIKYNGVDGSIEWDEEYSGTSTDIAYSLVVSQVDGSIYVTGSSKSGTEPGTEDMYTLKYGLETGEVLDSLRYDGPANDEDVAYDIALDTAGNIYITGYTVPLGGGDYSSQSSDYITLKYAGGHLVKKSVSGNNNPFAFRLYQNYPNPFNPSTTLKFSVPYAGPVNLTVYDVLGKEVDVLVDQYMTAGEYSVAFKGSNIASGIYFYKLTAGNFKDVKKMILTK